MHDVKKVGLCAGLLAGIGFSAGLAAQTVYKSVDEQGNVSYTDRPPLQQGTDQSTLDIMAVEIRPTDPAAIAANRDSKNAAARVRGLVDDARAETSAEEADAAARKEQERAAGCERARQRLARYASARRIYNEGVDGERQYLDDQEIDAARMEAARAVDEWCGN